MSKANVLQVLPMSGLEQCSCERWYPTGGAALCAANRHGKKEAPYGDDYRHVGTVELTAEVFCAECSAKLGASLKLQGDRIVLSVLPHLCPVPDPFDNSTPGGDV
jgi:hypothetical protein